MAEDYWSKRWQRGETGFHQKEVNAQLRRFWPHLGTARGSAVLVPLCGKSEDMAWLRAQGHTVIGIDLAEQAVRAFFAEHELEPVHHKAGPLARWSAAGFELYVGDFFALRAGQLAGAAGRLRPGGAHCAAHRRNVSATRAIWRPSCPPPSTCC